MNVNMHRRKINAVYWPDTDTEQGRMLWSGDECGELYLSATYHGDRDEFWIVQEKHGTEVARHNPRFVETIKWADA